MFAKWSALGLLVAAACLVAVAFAGEQDVLNLTDDDFATRVAESETTLVMFYAPWCGHCKRLKPEYFKAGELLRQNENGIGLAMVDCTEGGKETCSKFSITGYPTLKIFRAGAVSADYNGPREAAGIVKFLNAQTGPASRDLTDAAALAAFTAVQETSVLGFFAADSPLKTVFLGYADKFREKVRFAHSSAADVLAAAGHGDDAIVLYRASQFRNKFEPDTVSFAGAASIDELTAFVKAHFHGLVGLRTRDAANDFKAPSVVAYYAVDYKKNPKGTQYWRNRVLKVASELAADSGFTFAISSKDDFQHELNDFGLDYTGDKPVVLARDAQNQKFRLDGEFSVEALAKFVRELRAGQLQPYLKSEEVPADNSGPVTVAVGKNFDEVVLDNGKDTLVEFYAPWCGHCKKLTPVFEELGTKLAGEQVAIVKMDATANDVPPQFEVRGFPTLFWLPKAAKSKPVKYEGGREVEDFVKYIAAHASEELAGFDRAGAPKKAKTEL